LDNLQKILDGFKTGDLVYVPMSPGYEPGEQPTIGILIKKSTEHKDEWLVGFLDGTTEWVFTINLTCLSSI